MAKPNATQADRVRFEAVANALWEHENFGAIKQSAGDYSDAYFAQIKGETSNKLNGLAWQDKRRKQLETLIALHYYRILPLPR